MRQKGLDQPNQVSARDALKKLDHFCIQHFHATTAEGLADAVFMVGAMDVDVAVVAVARGPSVAPGFQSAEPEYAAGDQVTLGILACVFGKVLAGGYAALEDHPAGLALADLVSNLVEAGRRAVGIGLAGGGLERGGNAVNFGYGVVFDKRHPLLGDGDNEASMRGGD